MSRLKEISSSSGGEEASSEEEEEVSGSESELDDHNSIPPPANPPTGAKNPSSSSSASASRKPQPPAPSSSDSESASDSEPDAAAPVKSSEKTDPNVKIKPSDDKQLKKGRSTIRDPPPAASKPSPVVARKRAAPDSDDGGKESKRSKRFVVMGLPAPVAEEEKEKKKKQQQKENPQTLFIRIWSEEDEVFLINSMISYVEKNQKDPIAHVTDFYESVKHSLPVGVDTKQTLNKLKRMKKKFEKNAKRQQEGKVRSFSNPHELKMFELSKRLWGGNEDNIKNPNPNPNPNPAVVVGCSTKNPAAKEKGKAIVGGENVAVVVGCSSKNPAKGKAIVGGGDENPVSEIDLPVISDVIMSKVLESVCGGKKEEILEEWKKVKIQELEMYLKKIELVKEQGELILDAIKKS